MAEISKATSLTCLEDDEHEPSSARNAPWAAAHASSAAARPSLRYWPSQHALSASLYGLPPPYEWPPAASLFTSSVSSVVPGLSSNANASPPISAVVRRSYDSVFVSSDPAYYGAHPYSAPVASPTTENLNSFATRHVSCASSDGHAGAPSCHRCTCQSLSGPANVFATNCPRRD